MYPPNRFICAVVPRDADCRLNSWETVMVGSYDDLESALTAPAVEYGAVENG